MKSKILFVVLMIAIVAAAWYKSGIGAGDKKREYEACISEAVANEEVRAYKTAMNYYAKALSIDSSDIEVCLKYADMAYNIGYYNAFVSACMRTIKLFPQDDRAYILLGEYYFSNGKYSDVVNLVKEANKSLKDISAFKEMYMASAYRFRELQNQYANVKSFVKGYAAVEIDSLWGIIRSDGSFVIQPVYEDAEHFSSGKAAVKKDGEYYFIDLSGYRVLASKEKFDKVYSFNQGLAIIKRDGKYGYANSKFIPGNIKYEFATNFNEGIAALKNEGKWAIVKSGGTFITEYIFDDIKVNEQLVCYSGGVILAKKNGKYMMYDNQGKIVSDQSFDDACAFAGNEPTAVKIGQLWGYADSTGNIVIEPKYAEARPFSQGVAPVREGEMWQYITVKETVVIEPQYEDARPFSSDKIAAVKKNGVWKFIQFLMN